MRVEGEELPQSVGVIDSIVAEPEDGAHSDPAATARALRSAIVRAVRALSDLDPTDLLANRYARLRSMGAYLETPVMTAGPIADGSLRRRIGRILHVPGMPKRGRWSDVWPGDDDTDDTERGA